MKHLLTILLLTLSCLIPVFAGTQETHYGWGQHFAYMDSGAPPPSCEVVKFRLQEYAKRNSETDYLMEWYSPQVQTVKQSRELLNVFRRMPSFLHDRIYEELEVTYVWTIRKEAHSRMQKYPVWKNELKTSKFDWKDPFNGQLPPGVELSVEKASKTLMNLSVKIKMSLERYCLEDERVFLKLETPEDVLTLEAENESIPF